MNWKPMVKLALQIVAFALDLYCASQKSKARKTKS